jgi:hypothetical protein
MLPLPEDSRLWVRMIARTAPSQPRQASHQLNIQRVIAHSIAINKTSGLGPEKTTLKAVVLCNASKQDVKRSSKLAVVQGEEKDGQGSSFDPRLSSGQLGSPPRPFP